jgi:hypothetical protein
MFERIVRPLPKPPTCRRRVAAATQPTALMGLARNIPQWHQREHFIDVIQPQRRS